MNPGPALKADPALAQCSHCGQGFNSADDLQRHEVYCGPQPHFYGKPEEPFSQQLDPPSTFEEFLDRTGKAVEAVVEVRHGCRTVKRTHPCTLCDKVYGKASHLKRHVTDKHTRADGFTCPACRKTYKTENSMKEHVKRVHNSAVGKNGTDGEKGAADEERKSQVGESAVLTCADCEEKFDSPDALQKHQFTHIAEQQFDEDKSNSCSLCGECFATDSDALKHACGSTADGPKGCLTCGLTFLSVEELKRHQTVHAGDGRRTPCDVCQKTFSCDSALRKHQRRFHQETREPPADPTLCRKCCKRFPTAAEVKTHDCAEKDTKPRPYPCFICERTFLTADAASRHVQTHSSLRPFVCLYCREGFKRKDTVKTHVLVMHKGEPPKPVCFMHVLDPDPPEFTSMRYCCLICNLMYNSESELVGHDCPRKAVFKPCKKDMAKLGVMPCQYCDDLFETSEELEKHQQVHDRDRPYRCSYCGKTFRRKDTAKEHVDGQHTTEQPKDSPVVMTASGEPVTFRHRNTDRRSESTVKKHLATHSQLECEKCGAVFNRRGQWRRHCEFAHAEEPPKDSDSDEQKPLGEGFPCPVCLLVFPSSEKVTAHVNTHSRNYTQPTTKSLAELTESSPERQCPTCGVYFFGDEELQSHVCAGKPQHRFYPCPLCEKVFPKAHHVRKHLVSHSDFRPYVCMYCKHGFKSTTHLYKHIRKVHKTEPVTRRSVEEQRENDTSRPDESQSDSEECEPQPAKQRRLTSVEVRRECPVCYVCFGSEETLGCHMRLVHNYPEKPQAHSPESDTTSDTTTARDDTVETEWILVDSEFTQCAQPPRLFECKNCAGTYVYSKGMRRHCKECPANAGLTQFHCTLCAQTFRTAFLRDAHEKKHAEDFTCVYCNMNFSQKRFVRRHINRRHRGQLQAASAAEVARAMYRRDRGKTAGAAGPANGKIEHSSVRSDSSDTNASDDQDCRCTICLRRLTTDYDFTGPQTSRPVKCANCDYSFTNEFCLKLHEETHKNPSERPRKRLRCEEWTEEVCLLPALPDCYSEEEWTVLADDEPRKGEFCCALCGRCYQSKASLKRHIRVHHDGCGVGFPCNVCGWKFVSADLLHAHIPKHRDSAIDCIFCSRRFETKKYLRMHYLRIHRDEIASVNDSHTLVAPISGRSEYDNSFPCAKCKRAYKSRYSLVKHLELCSLTPLPPAKDGEGLLEGASEAVICCYCGQLFAHVSDLRQHTILTHTGETESQESKGWLRSEELAQAEHSPQSN